MLGTNTFRLYGNDDPIGAQLGGAAKNVIAIAAGAVTKLKKPRLLMPPSPGGPKLARELAVLDWRAIR